VDSRVGTTRGGRGCRSTTSTGSSSSVSFPLARATRLSSVGTLGGGFVHGLEQGGVPLAAVDSAVRGGALSFAFFDGSYWDRFGGLAAKTYRELSAETGLSLDLLQAIRESMGFARPGTDDPVGEDELDVVVLVRAVIAMGADPVVLERHMGIAGRACAGSARPINPAAKR
jgi:hypothetical protein